MIKPAVNPARDYIHYWSNHFKIDNTSKKDMKLSAPDEYKITQVTSTNSEEEMSSAKIASIQGGKPIRRHFRNN